MSQVLVVDNLLSVQLLCSVWCTGAETDTHLCFIKIIVCHDSHVTKLNILCYFGDSFEISMAVLVWNELFNIRAAVDVKELNQTGPQTSSSHLMLKFKALSCGL